MCPRGLVYVRCSKSGCDTKKFAFSEEAQPCSEIKTKHPNDPEKHIGTCKTGIECYQKTYMGRFTCDKCRAS